MQFVLRFVKDPRQHMTKMEVPRVLLEGSM